MKISHAKILLILLLGIAFIIPVELYLNSIPNAVVNTDNDEKIVSDPIPEETEGLRIVPLEGSADQRGRAYGALCKEGIQQNIQYYWEDVFNAGFTREEVMVIVRQMEELQEPEDPDTFIEFKAIAEAAEVPYDDILAFNLFTAPLYESGELESGCTAWVAHGTATANGNTIMHKNRDDSRSSQVIVDVAASGSNHGYRGIVTEGNTGVGVGINDEGLATGNTYVGATETNIWGKGSLTMTKEILKTCASIDAIFTYLDGVNPQTGSNQFCADVNKGAIIEYTSSRHTTAAQSIVQNDVSYRANYFVVLSSYNSPSTPSDTNLLRYQAARDFCEAKAGSLTALGFNALSRSHYEPTAGSPSEHDGVDGSISNYHTLCGVTFEIDKSYPKVLSVMWAGVGTPDTAIYTPIHIGSTIVHSSWTNGAAWDLAELILTQQDTDNAFPFGSLIPHYLEFESTMMTEEASIRSTADGYLDSGQTSQAQSLLTTFDSAKGNSVYSEMETIEAKQFWQDSFHYTNGIETKTNIAWNDAGEYVGLTSGQTSGSIASVSLSHDSTIWSDYWFVVDQSVPSGTSVTYKILDSSSNMLSTVSSSQALEGYDLSGISVSSIKLRAELTSTSGSITPVLYDWTIKYDPNFGPVDTTAPAKVTGVSATTLSSGSIKVSWTANSESDLNHYNVYRNGVKVATCYSNSYTDSGLSSSTTYTYQISAVDASSNEGTKSDSASATTSTATQPTMNINSITMSYTKRYSWFTVIGYYIYTDVYIYDGTGAAVSSATVSLEMTLPDGTKQTASGSTDSSGFVEFKIKVNKISGTYVSLINAVSKSGYVYDSTSNVKTSQSLTI